MRLIESHIGGSVLKNNLARAVAFEELMKMENHKNHEKFLQQFILINNSKSYLTEVLDLHIDIEDMSAGKILPELKLQNHQLKIVSTIDLIEQPTVFYFWSQTQMSHYRKTILKAKKTRKNSSQSISLKESVYNHLTKLFLRYTA